MNSLQKEHDYIVSKIQQCMNWATQSFEEQTDKEEQLHYMQKYEQVLWRRLQKEKK